MLLVWSVDGECGEDSKGVLRCTIAVEEEDLEAIVSNCFGVCVQRSLHRICL